MDEPDQTLATSQISTDEPGIETGATFLGTLFVATDTIIYRPIETWLEAGKKRSRVDYSNTFHRQAVPTNVYTTLLQQFRRAAKERLNLFFGVCPRFGGGGRYDLAWQIRTVRVLWTDIDHVTVDQARERITKAGLPLPSIIVNSGNGVHLYWLLDQPYLIDDAGDPPAVENEWIKSADGRKKPPRKYVVENGEKVYLDARRHISRLSEKAQHCQDVLAGIAKVVGGDHTTDLSRLLRIPGTLNRKDQRNGREPMPTVLVECEPTRRYSFSDFERLAIASPDTERAKKVAVMPLPQARKLSPSKADKLAELIATCEIAPAGKRSEADFALCCYAIRNGIDKEHVWSAVEKVGKFAEQGRRYFDRTWDSAEFEVRSINFDKLQRRMPASFASTEQSDHSQAEDGGVETGDEPQRTDERPTIHVDTETPVHLTMRKITDQLLEAKDCFVRIDQLVVIRDRSISPILSSAELAGLLNHHVEFYFIDDEDGAYKPLPANFANTWLNHPGERTRLPAIKLFTHNPVYSDDWRLVAPGFDAASGIYYAGSAVEPRNGTEHLDTLLRDFCFRQPADRTNYLGMLLTAMLIPRFIGSKPAVLFNGNQPELGKSILAQIIAIVRDGAPTETATYNPNDEEFEKRLGALVRRGTTTIIVDNAKGRGRSARIESACLERSITDPILSFRLLGYSADIRAENSHLFCITANSPEVSRDLVTRSVVINLYFEGDPERRQFTMADPEGFAQEHRDKILGELIGMVELWKAAGMPMAAAHSRFNKKGWGTTVGGILQACGEPDFLANAGDAAMQLDETQREFTELVAVMADHPQGHWTAGELVDLCKREQLLVAELGDRSPRSQTTTIGILAGRFIEGRFPLSDGRQAIFHKQGNRNGNRYRVEVVDDVRNL